VKLRKKHKGVAVADRQGSWARNHKFSLTQACQFHAALLCILNPGHPVVFCEPRQCFFTVLMRGSNIYCKEDGYSAFT